MSGGAGAAGYSGGAHSAISHGQLPRPNTNCKAIRSGRLNVTFSIKAGQSEVVRAPGQRRPLQPCTMMGTEAAEAFLTPWMLAR